MEDFLPHRPQSSGEKIRNLNSWISRDLHRSNERRANAIENPALCCLVVNFLRVYGKCWVPVRLETAPTGIVE